MNLKLFENLNLSHKPRDLSLQSSIQTIHDKIVKRRNLPYATVEKQLEILNLLANFDLGRFLIERGGLNGYWTNYIITHPNHGRLSGLNNKNQPMNTVEKFLLDRAPSSLATQQRFQIFKTELQKKLKNEGSLASIPCGLMTDLIELDFSATPHFSLTGIDIDIDSLDQAQQLAQKKGVLKHSEFLQKNAWNLNIHNRFDVITSNGLSIYESDNDRVIALYCEFFKSIKPGGYLIISFLTPPPITDRETEWNLDKVDPTDALLQKIIFTDILDCKWQVFRPAEKVKNQLECAGFEITEIIFDNASIFPTITAKKPL